MKWTGKFWRKLRDFVEHLAVGAVGTLLAVYMTWPEFHELLAMHRNENFIRFFRHLYASAAFYDAMEIGLPFSLLLAITRNWYRTRSNSRPVPEQSSEPHAQAPRSALFIVALVAPRTSRNAVVGDAMQRFATDVEIFGRQKAIWLLYKDVIADVCAFFARLATSPVTLIVHSAVRQFIRK